VIAVANILLARLTIVGCCFCSPYAITTISIIGGDGSIRAAPKAPPRRFQVFDLNTKNEERLDKRRR
jgi:hypothetical protein